MCDACMDCILPAASPGVSLCLLRKVQRRHGNRTRWMHVREHLEIVANEFRVSRHPHIELQVRSRFTGAIFDAEAKQIGPLRFERLGIALPDHAEAARERSRYIHRLPDRRPGSRGVIGAQRPARRDIRNLDLRRRPVSGIPLACTMSAKS